MRLGDPEVFFEVLRVRGAFFFTPIFCKKEDFGMIVGMLFGFVFDDFLKSVVLLKREHHF
mgnify:CR=1 FL=1